MRQANARSIRVQARQTCIATSRDVRVVGVKVVALVNLPIANLTLLLDFSFPLQLTSSCGVPIWHIQPIFKLFIVYIALKLLYLFAEMSEWLNVLVSKIGKVKAFGGSNPPLCAISELYEPQVRIFYL